MWRCRWWKGTKASARTENTKRFRKNSHFIFDSVIFSNTKNEKVKINIKKNEVNGYVIPRMEFDWILFREATKKVEEKNGYVIQNFRVTDLLIDAQNRISGIKGKSESKKKNLMLRLS